MTHLDALNRAQREAATTLEGPLLIVAGAGAGKTKTVTHRILHLIESGVKPERILAITFTNKAAREMKERIAHLIPSQTMPFVSTFHALGVYILKTYGAHLGLSKHFTIYDKSDSKRAVKDALTEAGFDPKQFDPAKVQNAISRAKGDGMTLERYKEDAHKEFFKRVVASAWERYEDALKKEHALDFDDLLLKTLVLLERYEDVRTACQEQWTHIHIDEYQDTNTVQDKIAEHIAAKYKNICVVGDTDQNIYSWRGAQIQNMLNFERKYPGAHIVRLEENYRSTKTIIAVANDIIKKNRFRIEKHLFTNNPDGDKIILTENYDETQEAYSVAEKIRKLIERGVSAGNIAILYRANFQSRILEEALMALSVPYQMIGVRFFERAEIKDVLAYIRAALNPASASEFKRALATPSRGVGKVTLEKILSGAEDTLPASMRKKIADFRTLLQRIKDAVTLKNASELIKFVIEESGLKRHFEQEKEEGGERLENIKELVTLALSYDMYEPGEGIDRLLTDVSLATDEETEETKDGAVKLMTVHAAKGLEFEHVFITGLEDQLFPHKRMGETHGSSDHDEEERRLFYVAVTRARTQLHLSYAQTRTIFGSRQVNIPSEFLFDINDMYIEREEGTLHTPTRKPLFRIDF